MGDTKIFAAKNWEYEIEIPNDIMQKYVTSERHGKDASNIYLQLL